jgi:hypothetical protein
VQQTLGVAPVAVVQSALPLHSRTPVSALAQTFCVAEALCRTQASPAVVSHVSSLLQAEWHWLAETHALPADP